MKTPPTNSNEIHEKTKSRPEVSVVVGVYRGIDLLPVTLKSILIQTLWNIEVVLVDDGNNLDDKFALRALAETDTRIRLVENAENHGLTASLIIGCEAARAPLIARIDNGDLMVPKRRLATQREKLRRDRGLAIVGGQMDIVDLINGDIYRTKDKHDSDNDLKLRAGRGKTVFSHVTVMFKKSAYLRSGGYNPLCYTGQDTELWPRILEGGRGCVLNEVLAVAIMKHSSISVKNNNRQILNASKRYISGVSFDKPLIKNIEFSFAALVSLLKLIIPVKYRMVMRYRKNCIHIGKLNQKHELHLEDLWRSYHEREAP